jgi:hypothetical protein
LFDLDDAAARRDQITAAHDRGDLMARGPRTHRHEPRSGGGGPPSPSAGPASPPAARPLGGIFAKAKPVDRERFLRELDEERRLEWRKGGREGDPPPGWRPDHWDE